MDIDQIKKRLGPCGIHCGKCFAFKDGNIGHHSKQLQENLGHFDVYAKRFVDLLGEPVFEKYAYFKDMLQYFAEPQCGGCRAEKCKIFKACKVRGCSQQNGVDFCFECEAFPCDNTGFDTHLYERFVKINTRMKNIGVEAYYNEIKDKTRY